MRAHILVEALRSGHFAAYYRDDLISPAPEHAERVARAHKFFVKYDGLLDDHALHATAVEMWRSEVLQLPFDEVYVEIETPQGQWNAVLAWKAPPTDFEHGGPAPGDSQVICRPFAYFDRQWHDVGVFAVLNPRRSPPEYIVLDHAEGDYKDLKKAASYADYGAKNLVDLTCFLSTKHAAVKHNPAPDRLNARRTKDGRVPLFEYHIVTVDRSTAEVSHRTGSHASPRLHWRRGHVRTLPSGIKVPVKPCLVGVADRGFIAKDYLVKNRGGEGQE